MKNKKLLVGIALLIVVLVIGIGYAAITDSLTITGTAKATANDDNFKVVFNGTKTADDGVTATVTAGEKTASMDVTGLTTAGETKSATFTIQNQSAELNALVDVKAQSITNTEFFAIETEVADTTALAPQGTTTVTVTVKLIKTPIEEVTGTINVELEAEAALGSSN